MLSAALPLYRRPGSVAVLSTGDERLESAAAALSLRWHTKVFRDPAQLRSHLQHEPAFLEADAWNQLDLVRRWQGGQDTLVRGILEYWAKFTERFAFTRVVVIDTAFTQEDMAELRQLEHWHGSEVRVATQEDASPLAGPNGRGRVVVVPPNGAQLAKAVRELQEPADSRLMQVWGGTLSPEQANLLSAPQTCLSLQRFLASRLTEYVILADPFGAIGLTPRGKVAWVPLSVSMAPTASTGPQVSDAAFLQALRLNRSARSADPVQLGLLTAAVFEFDDLGTTPMPAHYTGWLKRQKSHISS